MGWFFRKSAKFGPFRLNFSKSGIGVSAGVRGARVSTGPRGTYLNLGRGGVYYRQKVGQGTHQSPSASAGQYSGVNLPPGLPAEVTSLLPGYPQFPKHGLPRIVKTLGLFLIIATAVSLWALVISFSINHSQTAGPSAPPATQSISQQPSYREALTLTKDGRHLVYVVVDKNLRVTELNHIAMLLHANKPLTLFRLFDDEAQLQQFKDWEVQSGRKRPSYPKQWAEGHYIADIRQVNNPHAKKMEWQLTDPKGKRIAALE